MTNCTNEAVDLWPLFWAAIVIGITIYNCLELWLEKKHGSSDDC